MDVRTLAHRRGRVIGTRAHDVTKIVVRVTGGSGMDVDVKQPGRREVAHHQSRLFVRLADRRVFGRLARVHVTTWLDPDAEAAMAMEDHATFRHDKG